MQNKAPTAFIAIIIFREIVWPSLTKLMVAQLTVTNNSYTLCLS